MVATPWRQTEREKKKKRKKKRNDRQRFFWKEFSGQRFACGQTPSCIVLATQCRSVQRAEPERRNFGQRFAYGRTPGDIFPLLLLQSQLFSLVRRPGRLPLARRGGYPMSTVRESTIINERTNETKKMCEKKLRAEVCLRADAPFRIFVPATQRRQSMSRTKGRVKRKKKFRAEVCLRADAQFVFFFRQVCVDKFSRLGKARRNTITTLPWTATKRGEEKRKEK